DKVILSFGTNDIARERHGVFNRRGLSKQQLQTRARNGIRKFRQPVANIVRKVKSLFPRASVVIQCVLPMKNMYWYTSTNVITFNDMLKDIAGSYNCYYIDCFERFLSADMRDYNRGLFYDWLHPNKWGLNLLCKSLKYVTYTNSNMFSSIIKL
ncbi:MAG: SGNH/GDSL hydrolase family protein, partial [Cytophagales bacterium]|nr:SGNH/GDSL hydrolase family protein [Cytophagales bacterium]